MIQQGSIGRGNYGVRISTRRKLRDKVKKNNCRKILWYKTNILSLQYHLCSHSPRHWDAATCSSGVFTSAPRGR